MARWEPTQAQSAIDPTACTQASRTRDTVLLRCWPAIGDEETRKRVRAAARAQRPDQS